jgi:transcriptional regulator with XRE-family HTH domain
MNKADKRNLVNIQIGERIQHYRKKAGLSQEEVAEQSGLTQKHISRIEGGYHSSLFITIMMIAKAVNVPIDAFTENIDENSNSAIINTIIAEMADMNRTQLEMLKDNIETIKRYNII